MSDYVRRLIPYGIEVTDALEGWLEEMAQEGLVLVSRGFLLVKFQRKGSHQLRYRIECLRRSNLERAAARRTQVLEGGWTYVTSFGNSAVYQTDDMTQAELPEDPKGSGANQLARRTALSFWGPAIVFSILFVGIVFLGMQDYFGTNEAVLSALMHYTWGGLISEGIRLLFCLLILPLALDSSLRLRRRVRAGRFPDRSSHTKDRARLNCSIFVLWFILLCATAVLPHSGMSPQEQLPLESYTQTLPFPRVEEIDGIASQEGFLTRESVPITREILRIHQDVPATKGQRGFSYQASCYELRREQQAKTLFREISERAWYHTVGETIPASEGVQAFFLQSSDMEAGEPLQFLVVQYGARVIEVTHYSGETDLRTCLPLFEEHLMK